MNMINPSNICTARLYDKFDNMIGAVQTTSITLSKDSFYSPLEATVEGYLTDVAKDKPAVSIAKVIFSGPVTVVLWSDGSKTLVRCQNDDAFDPEKGLAMAIAKKFFGNKGKYYDEFKKWLPEEEETISVNISASNAKRSIADISKEINRVAREMAARGDLK